VAPPLPLLLLLLLLLHCFTLSLIH